MTNLELKRTLTAVSPLKIKPLKLKNALKYFYNTLKNQKGK